MTAAAGEPRPPDLAALTGVRSGKGSYYQAYVRSDERLQRAVRAMDSISHALVRTVEGPRGLLEEVARAASEHLAARWTILALTEGELHGARPRFLVVDARGECRADTAGLPRTVVAELDAVRAGSGPQGDLTGSWIRVPMTLEGRPVGHLSALHGLDSDPEADDLAVLRILANQAAVSLHTSEQFQASLSLHRRAQRLHDDATAKGRDLAKRTAELRDAEQRLVVLHQRELIDTERHRIARELHDSVAQYVLSAGMAVELARGEAEDLGADAEALLAQLTTAKELSAAATDQLRRSIYALDRRDADRVSTLPELLGAVLRQHRPHLEVSLRVEGNALQLPDSAHHEIARAVGEALFNVASHAQATRAVVRIRYRPEQLVVSVADNGVGEPGRLSRLLRIERGGSADGHHRGLANMESRMTDLGGSLAFRRARIGGVRVELRLPLPLAPRRTLSPAALEARPLPADPES